MIGNMGNEAPLTKEQIIARGTQAGRAFLSERSEGTIHIEFPDNDEKRAKLPGFPLDNQLNSAIRKQAGNIDQESFSQILVNLAAWAEDNGWRRKDSAVGSLGVVELRKSYSDSPEEAEE